MKIAYMGWSSLILKSLEGNALSAARNYIGNAYASINTPLRRAIEEEVGWI